MAQFSGGVGILPAERRILRRGLLPRAKAPSDRTPEPAGAGCCLIFHPEKSGGGRAEAHHSDSSNVNILLVEDHEESRVILSNLLTHCGHEVANAGNIQDALLLLNHLQFDALVCDIGLPDGSGLDLVVEAKKRQPWKKTVALTGHEQSEEVEEGLRAGFDEYLIKPFDFHQLRSLLAASS